MNYLRDKRLKTAKRKKGLKFALLAAVGIIIIVIFRTEIFGFFSSAFRSALRPIWVASSEIKEGFSSVSYSFRSKKSLFEENQALKDEVFATTALLADRRILLEENLKLKDMLGRSSGKSLILASVLAKPNKSPYDTLVIDAGRNQGVELGKRVLAYGNIPIGIIAETEEETALVRLFSSPGEKTDAVLSGSNIFVQITGRGGQNFEISLAGGQEVAEGTAAVSTGLYPFIIGLVEKIISDPRDPFQTLILRSPVNVQHLKFVQVETSVK